MESHPQPQILNSVISGLSKVNTAIELRHFINATHLQIKLTGRERRAFLRAVQVRAQELNINMKELNAVESAAWQRRPKRPRSKRRQSIQPGRTASVVRGAFPKPTRKRHPIHNDEVTDPRFLSRAERERRNAKVSSA